MIFSYVLVLFTIHFQTLCWVGFYKYKIIWLSFDSNVVNLVYTYMYIIYMYNRKPQLYMAGAIPLFFLKSLGNKMNNHLILYFVHVNYV